MGAVCFDAGFVNVLEDRVTAELSALLRPNDERVGLDFLRTESLQVALDVGLLVIEMTGIGEVGAGASLGRRSRSSRWCR
jgi:hypothetical protein